MAAKRDSRKYLTISQTSQSPEPQASSMAIAVPSALGSKRSHCVYAWRQERVSAGVLAGLTISMRDPEHGLRTKEAGESQRATM
jgi:hypothetical protein